MYINTTTLDGSVVDENGAKFLIREARSGENGWVQSGEIGIISILMEVLL